MKHLFILISSIVIFCNLFGQTNSDLKIQATYQEVYNSIDCLFHLTKNSNVEFRLWTSPSLVSYRSCFILTNKSDHWQSRFFEFKGGKQPKWTETITSQDKLDSIWTRLLNNYVLTLPTQDSLNNRMRIYSADSTLIYYKHDEVYSKIVVDDGTFYTFQFFTSKGNRIYQYHSPVTFLKHNPNIEELYRAYAIISIVRKHLKLPLENE
jgi:hypothetical protein